MSNFTRSLACAAGALMASGWANNAHNAASASYTLLAISLLGMALIYAADAVMDLVEDLHEAKARRRKIHRKPQHTVQPNNNRKAG